MGLNLSSFSVLHLDTEFLVEAENDSTVDVTWKAVEGAKSVYILWCEGNKDSANCEVCCQMVLSMPSAQ